MISTMNSWNWGIALMEIIQHAFVMTLFISMIWIMVRRGKIKLIVLAFILSGVFTAGIVIVDYLTGSSLGPTLSRTPDIQSWGRYVGTLGHPNKLGFFLVLTTLLSLGQLFSLKSNHTISLCRMVWAILIVVQVFGIYLSGSLTAYLGMLLGILVLIYCSKSGLIKPTMALWLTLTMGSVAIIVVVLVVIAVKECLAKSRE